MSQNLEQDDGLHFFKPERRENFYGGTRSSLKYEMSRPQTPDFYWADGKYVHQKCGQPTQLVDAGNRSKPTTLVCEHCTQEELDAQDD